MEKGDNVLGFAGSRIEQRRVQMEVCAPLLSLSMENTRCTQDAVKPTKFNVSRQNGMPTLAKGAYQPCGGARRGCVCILRVAFS
jgi:hypothetical protein